MTSRSEGLGSISTPSDSSDSSIGRALISFAAPVLGASVLQIVTGSVNAFWVGRYLGDAALAGVSNANSVIGLLFSVAYGVWVALTILVAASLGGGNLENARRIIRVTAGVFAGLTAIAVVPLEIFPVPILRSIDVPPDSISLAVAYLRPMLISVPISYFYGMLVAALRGAGDTRTAFLVSVLSIGIDAGLNPVFIFGIGPSHGCGVAGSALATVLGQTAGLVVLMALLRRASHPLWLHPIELLVPRRDWRAGLEVLRLAGPMAIECLWGATQAVLMYSLVNRLGSDATAAYGAATQLWNLVMLPSASVGVAITSMAAHNIGGRRWQVARKVARLGVAYCAVSTALLVLTMEVLNHAAFDLFLRSRPVALAFATQINREASWSCIFFALAAGLISMTRAAGAVWAPLGIAVAGLGLRFPMAGVLLGRWQAQGIWWAFPASGLLTMLLAVFYYRYGGWRRCRVPGAAVVL
jgi:putative MATE family efflux protein